MKRRALSLKFALIICSTSRFQNLKMGKEVKDESGELAKKLIESHNHIVISKEIIPDDLEIIRKTVKNALESEADVIITCGGTGITPTDVTIEAVSPLIEKLMTGFGEIFRKLTFEKIGPSAILSRSLAGISKGKPIFCLPGAPHAIELALTQIILKEISHIILHARAAI